MNLTERVADYALNLISVVGVIEAAKYAYDFALELLQDEPRDGIIVHPSQRAFAASELVRDAMPIANDRHLKQLDPELRKG